MVNTELFQNAIKYLKNNFSDKIKLSFPNNLSNEKFTLHNLRQTWYPILIECLQCQVGIDKSEQCSNFSNWTLNQRIFKYKKDADGNDNMDHLDKLAPLIKIGLIFDRIDNTNVSSFDNVKFNNISNSIQKYVDRIGTLSNGVHINNRMLLAIIGGTQVRYEHYFGNWYIYKQQQHLNYLLDYYTEQFSSTYSVDNLETPHYLYTDVTGLVTENTFDALTIALHIYVCVKTHKYNLNSIDTTIDSDLIDNLNKHKITDSDINEFVKMGLVFNGCYVEDLEVEKPAQLFSDRFNLSSYGSKEQWYFYYRLFNPYIMHLSSKVSVSLVSSVLLADLDDTSKPTNGVFQSIWIDNKSNTLNVLQLNPKKNYAQYIYSAPLKRYLASFDFNLVQSFESDSLCGHTQTLIPLLNDNDPYNINIKGWITGMNHDYSKEHWDRDFKGVINQDYVTKLLTNNIYTNGNIPEDYGRTELALSPKHNILLFGAGATYSHRMQKSYCRPLWYSYTQSLIKDNLNASYQLDNHPLLNLNDKKLSTKSVVYQYIPDNMYLNGRSLQGYAVDDDLNIYVSCGKSPNISELSKVPPFLIFVKNKGVAGDTSNNIPSYDEHNNGYQRIDLGPDNTDADDDSWKQYLIDNDLLNVYYNNKAEILDRDPFLIEFENIQAIDTDEAEHYACYLTVAYHLDTSGDTRMNNIYRLDWWNKFDDEY